MRIIDSHTGGQPTRVIVDGGPNLGSGSLAERREIFARSFDDFRTTAALEPRGWDATVGALLCEPDDPEAAAGVIFFNTAGYLGMCGHGMIGLAVTLHYLGRLALGRHRIDTPVGLVAIELVGPNEVAIDNVAAYRLLTDVELDVPGLGRVIGDVAWGGNWFFLAKQAPSPVTMTNIPALTEAAWAIRRALTDAGITGADGQEIDHIEFFADPDHGAANSRNFVLCPGGAYDRSPCGTGTSAKLACLAADGKLAPGETWVQESIAGSRFAAHYQAAGDGKILPTIRGSAHIMFDGQLIVQAGDPFATGIK